MLIICLFGCQQNLACFLDNLLQNGIITLAEQLGDVRSLGRRMLARLQRLGQSLQNVVAHFLYISSGFFNTASVSTHAPFSSLL